VIAQRAVMTPELELPDLVADALPHASIVARAAFHMATESSNRALSFDVAARGGPRRARSVSPDYQMSLATILSARLLRVPGERRRSAWPSDRPTRRVPTRSVGSRRIGYAVYRRTMA
jgi:hypothetical protein